MRLSRLAAHKARMLLLEYSTSTPDPEPQAEEVEARPEMVCFRGQTLALVRHFFELSSQVGRVSSLLGREFFRARVSHHAIPSFEEQAVFVRDIELCIAKLSAEHQEIILLAGMYHFSHDEIAAMIHASKGAIHAWFCEAVDTLSEIFLEAGLLSEQRPDRYQRQVTRRRLPAEIANPGKKPPQSVKVAPERDAGEAESCAPALAWRPLPA